jgi:anti-anti-sigma regulatory factor
MTANLNTRRHAEIIIIEARDCLDPGRCATGLREKISELAEFGNRWILLDMSGVTELDANAARDLVLAGASMAMLGGDVKLMNVCRSLQESLTSVRLDRLFEAFGEERTAIQSVEMAQAARLRAASRRSELYWGR